MEKNLKNLSVINVFKDYECQLIIGEIEKNSNKLKISDEYGCETLSAYEMDIKELDSNIYGFINNRIKSLTKLKLEQSFVIKYNKELIPSMGPHYDLTTLSVVINLNNNGEDRSPAVITNINYRGSYRELDLQMDTLRIKAFDYKNHKAEYVWQKNQTVFIRFSKYKIFEQSTLNQTN